MRFRHLKPIIAICVLATLAASMQAQDLYVGQFNIRNANSKDAANGNGWERRCPVICDIFRVESFDVFGSQEVLNGQLEDLCAALPQYDYVGVGRNDGKQAGEYAPIFYKKDRFELLEQDSSNSPR